MHQAFDEHHLSFVFRTEGYTPFIQAMPDKYRDDDAVAAYRAYYHMKWFAKWEKGTPAPNWWQGVEVTA
jgi:hypothetical protein